MNCNRKQKAKRRAKYLPVSHTSIPSKLTGLFPPNFFVVTGSTWKEESLLEQRAISICSSPPPYPTLFSLSLSHLPIDQISCKRSVTQACSMCFQFLLSLHLSITTTKSSLFTPSPPPCSPHNVLPRPRPRRRQDKKRREERRDTTERVVPERRPTTLDFIPSMPGPHSPLRLCASAPSSSDASSSSSSSSTSQISMKTGEMEMFWGKQYFRSFFPASH